MGKYVPLYVDEFEQIRSYGEMPTKTKPLLADLIEEWLSDEPARAPSTVRRDQWGRDIILAHFGEDRLAQDISRADVIEFRELCAQTFEAASTPRIILRLLVRPLERAYVEGLIPQCPVVGMMLTTSNGGGSR